MNRVSVKMKQRSGGRPWVLVVPAAQKARPQSKVHMGWYGSGVNDPSAGSPTETLLRLLLPLNDKVQATSRR